MTSQRGRRLGVGTSHPLPLSIQFPSNEFDQSIDLFRDGLKLARNKLKSQPPLGDYVLEGRVSKEAVPVGNVP